MLSVALRTIIMYCAVILVMRFTGKRQIGELQIGELVVTVLISELAAMPIQDTDKPLLHALLAIAILVSLEVGLSFISLKSVKIRKLLEGRPSVLIENGKVDQAELKKVRFSVDDLVESLRQNGALSVEDVETAILETNGRLSVFLKTSHAAPSADDLGVSVAHRPIPFTVISDGRMLSMNLRRLGIREQDLSLIMEANGYSSREEIYYMSLDSDLNCFIIPMRSRKSSGGK